MRTTDDPIADFLRHDAERQRQLDRLPKCAYCHEPIQDNHCYAIDGDLIHFECAIDYLDRDYMVSVDDYCDRL